MLGFNNVAAEKQLNKQEISFNRPYRMTTQKKVARVISVTSGKGGVGKTHTTVNLGLSLSKLGKRVLLLDADLGLANINIIMGFQPKATLNEVISGKASLRDVIVKHPLGVDIIPASSGIPQLVDLNEDEKVQLLSSFEEFSTEYDYLIVDTGAGIGTNVMYFNVAAEQILVVIDSEPTSITDAYALIKVMATHWNTKDFNIVANRVSSENVGKEAFNKLSKACDKFLPVSLRFLGCISNDDSVSEAVMQQSPVVQLYPTAKASRDYQRLAKKIDSNEGSRTPKGGMQFFFQSLLENPQ